ncbi:Oligopeptide transport ATP-binding protein OppF [bacterium HR07]|uniref:Peptide/nickel transport system ATP-binding protein n=1 Tax=Acetithermum autotrophicum TaxID=1446466 RepID=H5SQE3_ACEAU|nr:peptide/nickel transport system ATP-binding protein [Candidatus Acetothermum autotrophicum]GBC75904.1 Oligopeptide transport ATP-binding protein OppF [bacterium HR07]
MQDTILLTVKDLHTHFELRRGAFGRAGVVRAVDGVSFELRHGEAIAVVGESGCGKSTLARTILGLYRPTKGKVFFEGRPLDGDLRWYRPQIGYIQQDPYGALPPFMDVHRILTEPLVINNFRGDGTSRIREVLEEVKLTPVEDFLHKFPHQLSGGQQQRLVIARAMILRPKFIVADEPVSMLDASVRVEILELLRGLQRSHDLTVIYITHDLSTVRYFAERIFVMYAGKIIEKAPVTELLKNPLHPYTQALLAAIPDPDPQNARTFKKVPPGEPPSLVNPPSGCRFHPRCPAFMAGLCDKEVPPEFEPSAGHSVECWLYRR